MLHRRIGYAAAVGAAVLFQIFYVGYLSTFVLALVLLLPLLSLALSLPSMRRASLLLSAAPPSLPRGEAGAFQLEVSGPRLPLSRVRVTLSLVNQLTGERRAVRREIWGAGDGAALSEPCPAAHCGRVLCTAERARVCDLLGLFSLRPALSAPCALLVLPLAEEPDLPPELTGGEREGAALRPRPGGGPGEDYDLREYRAGDPLRSIHWKLTSKRDELVVRETLEPHRAALVLTYDHFGAPEALDRTFDRLCALSLHLLGQERPHHIQWADPDTGAPRDYAVDSRRALLSCLEAAFSTPAPLSGKSILDVGVRVPGAAGPVRHLHVSPETGPEGGAA